MAMDENRLTVNQLRETRERALAVLQESFAHDKLTIDELERRVTAAHTSESAAEIEALVADLPPLEASATRPMPVTNALVPMSQVNAIATIRGTMSATRRAGAWDVPRRLVVRGLMSATVLDFREARFPPGPVDIEIHAVMSSVEIIVPPGLAVATDGSAFMGAFEQVHRAPAQPDPTTQLLRVRGRVIMGVVEVKLRLPGEHGDLEARSPHRAELQAVRADRAQMRHERRMVREQRRLLKEQRRMEDRRRRD
jgi:Domain of unknown function (DUF1707)/Cell wall-active antibiotics response 4TMS YvqF